MNIITEYQNKVKENLLTEDPVQLNIITKLQLLKEKLEVVYSHLGNKPEERSLYQKARNYFGSFFKKKLPQGVYLYSDVGRGKTMLMDLFFKNLNLKNRHKLRTHFHMFMRTIHQELQKAAGHADPIDYIIKTRYKKYKILCLDEFIVTDITDAMILSRVLDALLKYKILLITTSNTVPDNLYKNGLQRRLFLPAIDLIKNNMDVINLPGLVDYRTQMLTQNSCYYWPNNQSNIEKLTDLFTKLSGEGIKLSVHRHSIIILDREINYIALTEHQNLIWFDFNEICKTSRSQTDYIEIANLYQTVFISGLYSLSDQMLDVTRRLINLIDILYDCKVNLIICADCDINHIYTGQVLKFEFARCLSRLKEMQTNKYLAIGHLEDKL